MKLFNAVFYFSVFSCLLYGQLVHPPLYHFERWDFDAPLTKFQNAAQNLQPFTVNEKTDRRFSMYADDYFLYRKNDSTISRYGVLVLFFSKKDSALKMVQYIIRLNGLNNGADIDSASNAIWIEQSKRFGTPASDKTLPFLGKMRTWESKTTTVQLLKIESMEKALMVTYAKKK